jgi:hypothetical protein
VFSVQTKEQKQEPEQPQKPQNPQNPQKQKQEIEDSSYGSRSCMEFASEEVWRRLACLVCLSLSLYRIVQAQRRDCGFLYRNSLSLSL